MGSDQGMLQQAVPSPRGLGSAVGLQPRFAGGSDLQLDLHGLCAQTELPASLLRAGRCFLHLLVSFMAPPFPWGPPAPNFPPGIPEPSNAAMSPWLPWVGSGKRFLLGMMVA